MRMYTGQGPLGTLPRAQDPLGPHYPALPTPARIQGPLGTGQRARLWVPLCVSECVVPTCTLGPLPCRSEEAQARLHLHKSLLGPSQAVFPSSSQCWGPVCPPGLSDSGQEEAQGAYSCSSPFGYDLSSLVCMTVPRGGHLHISQGESAWARGQLSGHSW